MQSKTLIALGALITAALLALITFRSPEKGEKSGPRPRPIAAFKAADVKELELSSSAGKDKATLRFDGSKWALTAPLKYPADQSMVKTALEQLEKIDFGDMITEKKEKHSDLEVSEDKGAHVIARDGSGKVLIDAWIGKSVSGFTMLRPQGKDEVWQAAGLFKYSYAREGKLWRDHSILAFTKDEASKLVVESGGQRIALDKLPSEKPAGDKAKAPGSPAGGDDHWKIAESTVNAAPLDEQVPNQMVGALSTLQAADFDDTATPATAGIDAPRFKVTVTVKGQPLTLLVGATKGDDNWAAVEGKPQIYLLHKYSLERITQKPADFRDKTIVRAKEDDINSLDIAHGAERYSLLHESGAWKYGAGAKGELDAGKAKGVGSAFDELKGSGFSTVVDPVATGLGKPAGEVTLHLRDKSTVVLHIGSATTDGQDYYVQKSGSPDVLLAKKFQVDRFWKNAADLVKSAAPPPGPHGAPGMPHGMPPRGLPPGMGAH